MVAVISCLSQKGGVAKSSLARLVAGEYAARKRRILLADLDTLQATSLEWSRRRVDAGYLPQVPTGSFDSVKKVLKASEGMDVVIIDGRGFSDRQTLQAAEVANVILLPTGLAVDDLQPAVRLAHELRSTGIAPERLVFVLCRTGDGAREIEEAQQYIAAADYRCLAAVWPERAGFRRAHDEGRIATEVRHSALKARARLFADALIGLTDELVQGGKR
jgi:chromosome partitioning protein